MLDNLLPASPLRRYLLLNEGDGGDPGGSGGSGGGGSEARFTQADLDRVAGRARSEGRSTALAEVTEKLGGLSIDDAKAAIDAKAEADNAALSDAERARNEAAADRDAAAREKAEAAKERLATKVERKLIAAGVGQGITDDADGSKAAAAIARATRLIQLDPEADEAAIEAEIAAVKADVPALFAAPTGSGTPPPPGSKPPPPPPPPPPPGGGGTKTMAELGQETLRKAGIRARDAA